MSRRKFRPSTFEALEDRVALTAFPVPFAITSVQTAAEINPKFLVLTKNTENQIDSAITNDFNKFTKTVSAAYTAYEKGLAKKGADQATLEAQLVTKGDKAFATLEAGLDQVAHKLPFGGQNLQPVLDARIVGSAGVTDTTTKVNTPSLQTTLNANFEAGNISAEIPAIQATETLVQTDVKDYINLGVTNGDFKLGKGAILPALS